MLLTLAVVTLGMWNAWSLSRDFGGLARTELRLERLAGRISQLDEVLTMSARMSALTAEPAWEQRYRANEPELDAAIEETIAIAKIANEGRVVGALHQTASANEKLVELEHRAFERVRNNQSKEAVAILESQAYREQKDVYAQGIVRAVALIHHRVDSEVRAHSDRASIILVLNALAGVTLLAGWLGVLRLVRKNTELRATLVRDLQQAVHARDDFLAFASHELRTPLCALSLSVQSLVRPRAATLALPPAALVKAATAERQLKRLEASIEALLDVSRITSGRLFLELEDNVDLAAVARDTVERFGEQAAHEKSDMRLTGVEEPVLGRWDKARLEQIVSNLVSNAIKYGAGKPIDVHVTSTDEVAEVTVRDYGIGIPVEKQAAIFDRFERAVLQREYGGVGLGLWILREVVSAMGGEVSVQSRSGGGSTFRVSLPRRFDRA